MDHLICEPPSGDIAILLNLALIDRLKGLLSETPDREVGGILWGHCDSQSGSSGRRVITIDEFETIEGDRSEGLAYGFGTETRKAIAEALTRPPTGAEHTPIGFFRSDLRKGLQLDEADFSLFREYFSSTESVFLLARPDASGVPAAGLFFWEDGRLERRNCCAEFPLDGESLKCDGHPILLGSIAPAEFPAIIASSQHVPDAFKIQSRTARRAVYGTIGGALILCALVSAAILHYPIPTDDTSTISLSVERQGTALRLSWDPNASAVEHANSGILWISDGEKRRGLELNSATLKSGRYLYTPESAIVNFRLDLLKVLAQGSESVRYVASGGNTPPAPTQVTPVTKPSPSKPMTAAANRSPQPPPPPAPAPAEQAVMRPAPNQTEPVVSITTQPVPPSRVRMWMAKVPLVRSFQRGRYRGGDGFVPPRTIREVMPHVPQRLARELGAGDTRVDLKVSVDESGAVRQIDLMSPASDERLAKIAADALRHWKFEPARLHDKPVACDLVATLNFRNSPGMLLVQKE